MTDVGSRTKRELQRSVLQMLAENSDGLPRQELMTRLKISDPRLTITLVKARWCLKNKGHWYITDEGRQALERFKDPESLGREASRIYREWRASKGLQNDEPNEQLSGGDSFETDVLVALEDAEDKAWSAILDFVRSMKPYDFQNLIAGLLRAMSYQVHWIAPPGPDGGIDILAYTDPLGTGSPRIKVQVKRSQSAIAVGDVRSFHSVLTGQDVGIFVAMSGFTKEAHQEARRKDRMTLIDLEKLVDLWTEYYHKIAETEKRLLPIRPIYYLDLDRA